jgi:hypothetical protein
VGAIALRVHRVRGFQFFSPFLPLYVRELGVTDPARIALWSGVLAAVTPAVSGLLAPVSAASPTVSDARDADPLPRGLRRHHRAMGLVTSVEQLTWPACSRDCSRVFSDGHGGGERVGAARQSLRRHRAGAGRAALERAIGPAAGGFVASHFGTRAAFFVNGRDVRDRARGPDHPLHEVRDAPQPGGTGRSVGRRCASSCAIRTSSRHGAVAQSRSSSTAASPCSSLCAWPTCAGVEIAATSGVIISVAAVGAAVSATWPHGLTQVMPVGRLLLVQFLAVRSAVPAMALPEGWVALLALRTAVALCLGAASPWRTPSVG